MKISILHFFILPLAVLISCKDDVAPGPTYDYHAHIFHPDASQKHIGDTLHMEIEFESHTGEIVHNINVRIFNAATQAVVYNLPTDPHTDAQESYEYHDDLVLSAANGFSEGDWVIQAKVWGETDGEQEEVSMVAFHISN
jgi:hypothetical protein